MTYDNDNLQPLYIEAGEPLTPISVSGTRYAFEHIQFSGVPVVQYPDNFDPDDEESILDFFPKAADSMICFRKIKSTIKKFTEKNYPYGVVVDKDVGEKNSGFITPNGTLIPQIIYPWDFGRNELKMDATAEDFAQATLEKYYCWTPVKQTVKDSDNEELKKAVNTPKNYGVKVDVADTLTADYISILGKNSFMDTKTFKRTFRCNFPTAGVFALLLDFSHWEEDETGKNPCEAVFKFYNSNTNNNNNATDCDYVQLKASPNKEISVSINSDNTVSGSLNFNSLGQKIIHVNSTELNEKNVIYFYTLMNNLIVTGDLVTNSNQTTKNLICKKQKELDILNETEPPLNCFPAEHKQGKADYIKLTSKNVYVNFGDTVEASFNNCCANFAFAALRFTPIVEFSYFYRMSGEQTSTNDGLSGVDDYFCLQVGGKNFEYKGLESTYKSKKVYYDAETQTTIFRVDFKFQAKEQFLQLNAFELFGIVHITKNSGRLTDVLNGDGDFINDFSTNIDPNKLPDYLGRLTDVLNGDGDLMRFVTNVNISHGLDGTNGSLTLDKYLMMDLAKNPTQAIGALTLLAKNGYYSFDGGFNSPISDDLGFVLSPFYSAPKDQIFKGYAMEVQDQVSEGGSQLTVKLVGIQKKLSDMKLVNCPFWDGDQVFENGVDGVLNYMVSYSGCDLKYVEEFSEGAGPVKNIILPRSWNWQAPSTNFVLGTSVLDALNEIAKKINHQFVIQPDGCGYFYYMDEYGCPTWVKNGGIVKTYHESEIISMDIAPYLENNYNTFLTLGLLVKNDSQRGDLIPDGEKPGMKFTQTNIGMGDYPWSRIITNSEPGVVTIKELEKFHSTNVRFGKSTIFNGSITVPGWWGFYLFDKIEIVSDTAPPMIFYITGINHSINLQMKEWTTQLSIAQFNPGGA